MKFLNEEKLKHTNRENFTKKKRKFKTKENLKQGTKIKSLMYYDTHTYTDWTEKKH